MTFGYWELRQTAVNSVMHFIRSAVRRSHLWSPGRRNLLDYRRVENRPRTERRAPAAFRGFRILHLSDLHIEAIPDDGRELKRLLSGIRADALVITGDFRYLNWGDSGESMFLVEKLLDGLEYPHGRFAVLGNHDTLDMVERLERGGVRVLMNEAHEVRRDGESVWIAGTDDPHYFRLHDVRKALAPVPPDGFSVLLAHSPDAAREAARAGTSLYLCGHAHRGQICLPGGVPVIANLHCPRRFFHGAWAEGSMRGYTSAGVGASGVPVRFFSPPEIVVHVLE